MLTLCVVGCATPAKVKFVPPDTPPPAVLESVEVDKNDRTGEGGLWMNKGDGQKVLKERSALRRIIEMYRAYWEKTQ